jgi:hypothetical protein
VSITRSDGSIVVGYVDVKNGIAFDWTVASSPGAPVIDLDGNDAALAPADPPKPPSETSSLSPVTGLGPGVEAPCSVSPVTGLGPGASLGSGSVSPVTGLGPAAGSGSVSPVTGLGPVASAPVSRSPLTGL